MVRPCATARLGTAPRQTNATSTLTCRMTSPPRLWLWTGWNGADMVRRADRVKSLAVRRESALAVRRARGRLRAGPAVLLEPAHHVELGAHEVGRLRSRPVVLVVEAQHHGGDAPHLQRRVELFGLRDRRATVQLTGHEQGRRGDVPHLHERRVGEPLVRLVPERLMEKAEGE